MTLMPAGVAEVFAAEPLGWINGVPSFVADQNYAANFGKQWRRFQRTQLDSQNGTTITRDFLRNLLGHPLEELAGLAVLEVGGGAGRFTEYLVRYAQRVVAVDLSEAIFVNAALDAPNLVPAQVDLFAMPPLVEKFDLVLCRGVLQHTPDPPRAIALLHDWAKPGGRVVFDIYSKMRLGRLGPKYVWRAILRRTSSYDSFSRLLDRHVDAMLRTRRALRACEED